MRHSASCKPTSAHSRIRAASLPPYSRDSAAGPASGSPCMPARSWLSRGAAAAAAHAPAGAGECSPQRLERRAPDTPDTLQSLQAQKS